MLHPGHRAVLTDGFAGDEITADPVEWSTGQPAATADAVLWAIGRVRPNTEWLPDELLDEHGFVRVTPELTVPASPGCSPSVTWPRRIRCAVRPATAPTVCWPTTCAPGSTTSRCAVTARPSRRWGSVLGVQADGLEVFAANGRAFRFPAWSIDRVLQPWIVRWGIYRGIRDDRPWCSVDWRR